MTRRKLAALLTLAVSVLTVPALLFAVEMVRLDANVSPVFEAIELNLDASKTDYTGRVRFDLTIETATSSFMFHGENMSLDRVELRGGGATFQVQTEVGDEGLIVAKTDKPLAPGSYTLEVDFSKEYNTQSVGLYRMEYEGDGYLFTQFEAIDARKAFPCWDEPIFKIPYQMTIRIPEGQEAVTNTPVVSQKTADGIKTIVFAKTKPMPTYLIAIAAGPLESVPITGLSVPGRVYTVKGQSHLTDFAVKEIPGVLVACEEYFGSKYPYAKLDFIAIPEYWPGAMENVGAVTFADRLLLIDPRAASVSQKRTLVYVTAHELGHMWFGDLVTMSWWDDLWLNESFADWIGEKITDRVHPEYKLSVTKLRQTQSLLESDARPSTKPIRKAVTKSADITEDLGLAYGKGRMVLTMIEQWMGEDAFRAGVLKYLDTHAWGNTVAEDLWNALSVASGKDIKAVLTTFLDQPGYPLVSVEPTATDELVRVTQKRFTNHGVESEAQQWVVPVRLKYFDGSKIQTQELLLDAPSKDVELMAKPEWITADGGGFAYYRWQAPTEMLARMAEKPTETMDERERVGFLGNVSALLSAGVMGGDDYLTVLSALSKNPEPEIIDAVMSGLGKVRDALVPDEMRDAFAVYVRSTLRPALDRFGMDAKEGEPETVSLLRPRLLSWLGDEGRDPDVRRHARKLAEAFVKDPSSIDASLAGTALDIAAIDGNRDDFEAFKKGFEMAKVPADRSRYLNALGAFSDREIMEAALDYSLEGPLRVNELTTIARRMRVSTAKNRDLVFMWVMENYDVISAKIPKEFIPFMAFYAGGCSTDRLAAAREFFGAPENQVEGMENNLKKVADSVSDCVNLREREGAAVAEYLSRLVSAR